MAKVLYLLNFAGRGGSERYIQTLVEELSGAGLEPFFAFHEPGPLLDWMKARGVPCRKIAMRGPYDIAAVRALAALCREWEIDVIHTHFLRENSIALLSRLLYRRPRVVYTYHILTENGLPVRLSNRLLSPLQDTIIANCTAGRDRLAANGNPAGKIVLIPNAVDLSYWRSGDGAAIRRELGIPEGVFTLLFAARLVAGKGHRFLLEALAQLKERDFRLVLAGEGELRGETEELCRSLGLAEKVLFPGFREDLPGFYAAADVTVCPSESETLSFLLLESLAAGTPVIATRAGGMTDIVTPEHDCGLMVDYGDRDALAGAVRTLMADPALRRRFGENARRTAEREYDLHEAARRVLALYRGGDKGE
jgi:glycosyltransferase involved in cell wall biosynthesis